MAKRTRGSRRDRRRGGRQATFAPPAARPAAPPRAPGLSPSEASEAVSAGPAAAPLPSSAPHSPTTLRPASVLAARAADEYRYVALDLRRIALVMGSLFGLMIVLWVVIDVMRLVTI